MIFITERAAEMVRLSAEAADSDRMPLRISATLDQDGKPRFQMGFDQQEENDTVWECNGVTVLVGDAQSVQLLENVVLDFQDLPPAGAQFTFLALNRAAGTDPADAEAPEAQS